MGARRHDAGCSERIRACRKRSGSFVVDIRILSGPDETRTNRLKLAADSEIPMTLCSYLMLDTLDDLLVIQLENLYNVELRITAAWRGLAEAAGSNRLKAAFQEHLHAAMKHVLMLDHVLKVMGSNCHRQNCEVIQYLVSQAEEVHKSSAESDVKIAALIVVARCIHHYKIAAYASLKALAQRSGRQDLVQSLQEAVDTEIQAEEKLTNIADSLVNRETLRSSA
jgi:ferritin-like metal-binding protein YciE